jgi:hypothetical protein
MRVLQRSGGFDTCPTPGTVHRSGEACWNGSAADGVGVRERERRDAAMKGLITNREIIRHAFTIIRLWGLRTYLRCLRATVSRNPATFLAVVAAGSMSHR